MKKATGENYAWFFRWCAMFHPEVVHEFIQQNKEAMKELEELMKRQAQAGE